jgi:hypothetical protein
MTRSPRQRDILENIESLFQDQNPDLASQLTGMRFREPARPARWMLSLTVLSILGRRRADGRCGDVRQPHRAGDRRWRRGDRADRRRRLVLPGLATPPFRSRCAGTQAVVWDDRQAGPIWPPAESDPNARPNGGLAMTVHGILRILPLAVNRLMRLGSSHQSRTGPDWRSRGSPWPVPPIHAHALDPVDGRGNNRRAS